MTWLDTLTEKALARELPTRAEVLEVLHSGDDELMDVVAAAFKVRLRYFGRRVKLNYLVNIKSGLCPEDCFYCSQRAGSAAEVLKYTWLKTDEIVASASAGVAGGARRVCLVASGRGPTDRDVDRVCESIEAFKSQHPDVEVCACLGLLSAGQADRLAAAGTTAYNHNLNTSGGHYADICSTHEYADRVSTVTAAKEAGLSPCSGLIAGMGETDEDLMDVAFALRHRWTGWDADGRLEFETPNGSQIIDERAIVLALGGASWPRLGSDGGWVKILAAKGVASEAMLARYRDAWDRAADRTPHGSPIELRQEDFRP